MYIFLNHDVVITLSFRYELNENQVISRFPLSKETAEVLRIKFESKSKQTTKVKFKITR